MLKSLVGKKKYVFECLNLLRHLKRLAGESVCVFNLKKIDRKTVSFFAFAKDDRKIKNEFKNAHMKSEENVSGLVYFFEFLKKNLAVILSFILCFSLFPVCNAFIWKIDVYAFDKNISESVQGYLLENNIKIGKTKSKYNTADIKAMLLERFEDIAFVDVEMKSETLIINVREKFYSETDLLNCTPVIAQFDGIVEEVALTSGTALVKAGDVVKAGDILAEAYIRRGEKFIPCEVEGSVKVRSFKLFEEEFCEKTTKFVRTGKKVTKNYFTFFKDFDKIKSDKVGFQNFDVQVVCLNEKPFPIVPVKITSVCFFELVQVEEEMPFEQNKESILSAFKTRKNEEMGAAEIFSEEISSEKIEDGKFKLTYYADFLKVY